MLVIPTHIPPQSCAVVPNSVTYSLQLVWNVPNSVMYSL